MGRSVAFLLALVLGVSSFVLLASTARTGQLRVTGAVEEAFRPAYDILVRPKGSYTDLEKRKGLIQQNYLSGIFGGISMDQYQAIRKMQNPKHSVTDSGHLVQATFRGSPSILSERAPDDGRGPRGDDRHKDRAAAGADGTQR